MKTLLVLFTACAAASVYLDYPIRWFSEYLHDIIGKYDSTESEIKELRKIPRIMGYVERPMYVLSYYLGLPAFIGIWLTLKAASGFGPWVPKKGNMAHVGRAKFMVNMICSGLSITGSVLIAILARWIIIRCFSSS